MYCQCIAVWPAPWTRTMIGVSGLAASLPGRQEIISNCGEHPQVIMISRMLSLFKCSISGCMIPSLSGIGACQMHKNHRLTSSSPCYDLVYSGKFLGVGDDI